MDGLAEDYITEVNPNTTIILPESCTNEFHLYMNHIEYLGKFRTVSAYNEEGALTYSWMYTDKYKVVRFNNKDSIIFTIENCQ